MSISTFVTSDSEQPTSLTLSPTTNPRIRLGLVCLNMTLREQKPTIFASRNITLKKAVELDMPAIEERAIQNIKDLISMIKWNEQHNIKVFRLTSGIFPHHSNPKLGELLGVEIPYSIEFARPYLKHFSDLAKLYGHRINFHPGHFNQLGTESDTTLDNTIKDLTAHAMVLEMMEAPPESTMVIHGGGMYCKRGEDPKVSKKRSLDRWVERYNALPEIVRKRIVLENCEKCYSTDDLLPICLENNIPLVLDVHHYECYCRLHPTETLKPMREIWPDVCRTWGSRRPELHISEQGSGPVGHHSDYISCIPDYLFEFSKYRPFDLMVEAKHKELAILDLYEKHPEVKPHKRRLILKK